VEGSHGQPTLGTGALTVRSIAAPERLLSPLTCRVDRVLSFLGPGRPTGSGLPRKQFENRSFAADISLKAVILLIRFAAVLAPRRRAHAG
jgi:hypothetical protein